MQLERWFAESPPTQAMDADGFATRVTTRLDRSWTYRQALIGGLGIVGGVIGGVQFLGSGLLNQLVFSVAKTNATVDRLATVRDGVAAAVQAVSDVVSSGATLDVRILVMSAALAVVAGGLFLTRAIREI